MTSLRTVPWSPAGPGARQGSARGPTSSIPFTIHEQDESAEDCVEIVQEIETGFSGEPSVDHAEISRGSSVSEKSRPTLAAPYQQRTATSNQSIDRIIGSLLVGPRITAYLADNSPVDFVPSGGYRCRCPELVDCVIRARNLDRLEAENALAVWFTDDNLEFEVQLKARHNPFVIQKYWGYFLKKFSDVHVTENPGILVYVKRSVFLPIAKERQIMDSRLLQLLFEEAQIKYLGCKYLFSRDDVVSLGVLLLFKVHGRFVEGSDFLSSVRFERFFPSLFLNDNSYRRMNGERDIKDLIKATYEETYASSAEEIHLRFLLICQANPAYGAAFFNGVMEARPSSRLTETLFGRSAIAVRIAVNEQGMLILPSVEKLKMYPEYLLALRHYEFTFCCRQPPDHDAMTNVDTACLMITMKIPVLNEKGSRVAAETRSLRIYSKQAQLIEACLSTFKHNRYASLARRREHLIDGEDLSDDGVDDVELWNNASFSGSNTSVISRMKEIKAMPSTFSHGDCTIVNHFEKFYLHKV
ncbi:putative FERM domain-containing protein FRMD8P1 isoform X2 [Paramacrobiotus metropolitanus]|uniref:putative FERM domain-containing protein FRMD8P1 isoform X2 n=1 Tax=Paramacrobiotus metropolitanus TaxID=2943436 RepID=UPI002445BAC2|nr:putative FERM domain-containing protein FRMD8P1 isoform X2 [Paramacrobiotus metropolitanus]